MTLNPKQQVFVAAYIGEAKENATEAARIAGYLQPMQQGSRLLRNVEIRAAIDEHLAAVKAQGIALKQNRIDALVRRQQLLERIISERAEELDGDAAGAGTGLLVRQVKLLGAGERASLINEYVLDTGLLREMREHEKQTAQEMGEWIERGELSGKDGGPILVSFPERKDGPQ